MRKCADCGWSTDNPDSSICSPYKLVCALSGRKKRRRDSCKDYWIKKDTIGDDHDHRIT